MTDRRKKPNDVREQVALVAEEIANRTRWATSDCPWLAELLMRQGYAVERGVLVDCTVVPEQGVDAAYGVWLDVSQRFFRFDVDFSRDPGNALLEVWEWRDVTEETDVRDYAPEIGKTRGQVALELLFEQFLI